jgi:alpha-galactosidase
MTIPPVATGSRGWGRAHFGAWCIVSSPLYLGFDLFDQTIMDAVLDVVGNREAIAVNQRWAGHPGTWLGIY